MYATMIEAPSEREWAEYAPYEAINYGPYEEDAARKNQMLSEWLDAVVAKLQMPWFIPRLGRVLAGISAVREGGRA